VVSILLPLEVRGAMVRRRGKVLIGPVDLTLAGAGLSIVIGPNGAGKTSLLKMLHGIQRLSRGEIAWPCGLEEARRRQAFVFQTPVMLRRTVLENLIYPLRIAGMTRAEARPPAHDWCARIGLEAAAARPATMLSGGERQKLALARALIAGPDLLFLDEPCASLDGQATREIESILLTAAAKGTRIVMSTHDMGQARRLADEVLFILNGQVHEHVGAEGFFAGPVTAEARAFLKGDIID